MEDSEIGLWPAHAALTPSFSGMGRQTLNEDPSNVLAEQLAMQRCMQGFDVVQEMSEVELLVTSCGHMIPGTPDGGFIDSDGLMRLIQVVRVPLLPGMDADEVADTLHDTVLTKIVKSQAWMKQTGILPHDFVIFCWLPPVGAYEVCMEQSDAMLWTEALMSNVRSGGWPFSLRVETPPDPADMFPTFFAKNSRERKSFLSGLCYHLNAADFDANDEDEAMQWDLFDEDFEELHDEGTADETMPDDATMRVLIALAIRSIERANDVQSNENVAPGFVDALLEVDHEEYSAPWQLPEGYSIQADRFCPYPIQARHREKQDSSPLIEVGRSWWDSKKPGHIEAKGSTRQRGDRLLPPGKAPLRAPSDKVKAVWTRSHPLQDMSSTQARIKGVNERMQSTGPKQRLLSFGKSWHHDLWLVLKATWLGFSCAA